MTESFGMIPDLLIVKVYSVSRLSRGLGGVAREVLAVLADALGGACAASVVRPHPAARRRSPYLLGLMPVNILKDLRAAQNTGSKEAARSAPCSAPVLGELEVQLCAEVVDLFLERSVLYFEFCHQRMKLCVILLKPDQTRLIAL